MLSLSSGFIPPLIVVGLGMLFAVFKRPLLILAAFVTIPLLLVIVF